MRKQMKLMSVLLVIMLLAMAVPVHAAGLPAQARAAHLQVPSSYTGEAAYEHVRYLSKEIGPRVASTDAELEATAYVFDQFEAMGYDPIVQPFTYVRQGQTRSSQNIIAVKPGRSDATVVVGAHYDSVNRGEGATDNASGVGVMLEVASVLKDYPTHANVVFIAFGAEEVGLHGSRYYVNSLSDNEIAQTVAMINMDMVSGYGDNLYAYSALNGATWVRDMALDIGWNQGIEIHSTVGLYYDGATGDWSDHRYFRDAGIPIVYFEHWNWHFDPTDSWGIENAERFEEFGDHYHTVNDTLEWVDKERMADVGRIVAPLVYELARTPLPNMNSRGVGKRTQKFNAVGASERIK
ncbi:MAG: M20/M25/M40 family metallo-hydrolase [Bacillota bacterium]|nr:M20/M25/M40 family metallo-hydrolase [Bacillota bacterium]MDW7678472.1 M20/M25/M40 family metallo-hydrolase [Bacillota bacterium]